MKIAIPSNQKGYVSEHFGRTDFFAIYDDNSHEYEYHDNSKSTSAAHGAGTQAAAMLSKLGITKVISPSVGPKAFNLLKEEGITVYESEKRETTIDDVIQSFLKGELNIMETPKKHA